MKKLLLILLVASCFSITSCSSDDDNSEGNNYPQTVNIKFDITTTQYTYAVVSRTLNNDTQTEEDFDSFPYSFTYVQQEVNQGTYLKLTFMHDLGQDGGFDDYEAELKITVENEVVKSETFMITNDDLGVTKQIDFTFE